MKTYLVLEGALNVKSDAQTLMDLGQLTLKYLAPVKMMKNAEGQTTLVAVEEAICPGEEEAFLHFLYDVGQTMPGQVVGEFEVWWPMCIVVGPQWWKLNEAGQLTIQESDIVRGEEKPYEVSQ